MSRIINSSLIYLCLTPLLAANGSGSIDDIYKTVEIKDGAVRGLMNRTILNQKDFFSFRGIPFAKPPVGELRFKVQCINSKIALKKWNRQID